MYQKHNFENVFKIQKLLLKNFKNFIMTRFLEYNRANEALEYIIEV